MNSEQKTIEHEQIKIELDNKLIHEIEQKYKVYENKMLNSTNVSMEPEGNLVSTEHINKTNMIMEEESNMVDCSTFIDSPASENKINSELTTLIDCMNQSKINEEHFNREIYVDNDTQPLISCSVATVLEEESIPELDVNDEEIMVHYNLKQKESYLNVKYDENISQAKLKELKNLVFEFREIFSDVPTITNLDEHKIELTNDYPIRS